jgi:hypothetical protein
MKVFIVQKGVYLALPVLLFVAVEALAEPNFRCCPKEPNYNCSTACFRILGGAYAGYYVRSTLDKGFSRCVANIWKTLCCDGSPVVDADRVQCSVVGTWIQLWLPARRGCVGAPDGWILGTQQLVLHVSACGGNTDDWCP